MAERRKSANRDGATERRPRQAGIEQKARETEKREREQKATSELDKPSQPDQPDHIRHAIYFFGVVVGAFVLNLVVLLILSGGR